MIKEIKKSIPVRLKQTILYYTSKSDMSLKKYKNLKDDKKIFVFLAADYGNIGDMAITYAQKQFLKDTYPEYKVIELTVSETYKELRMLKKLINSDDIITLIGGGNLGDAYKEIENQRRFIIKQFRKNKIISFPQTIDFSNTKEGIKSLSEAKKIYSNHPNLTIIAREKISFEMMKEVFNKNNILLTPDIVMSLDKRESTCDRDGIVLCLRNDKERKIDYNIREQLLDNIYSKYNNVREYDTWIGEGIFSPKQRNKELNDILKAFRECKVVVTDRLHGMIFCYITGTPCVVLPNSNHKVKGCYEWIKDCGYITLYEKSDIFEILNEVNKLYNINENDKRYINLKDKFII